VIALAKQLLCQSSADLALDATLLSLLWGWKKSQKILANVQVATAWFMILNSHLILSKLNNNLQQKPRQLRRGFFIYGSSF
jgi:hypothetical protein